MTEKGLPLDPWGVPIPPREALLFCDYVAPTGLPCTSRMDLHGELHFTADGWAWTKDGERT